MVCPAIDHIVCLWLFIASSSYEIDILRVSSLDSPINMHPITWAYTQLVIYYGYIFYYDFIKYHS